MCNLPPHTALHCNTVERQAFTSFPKKTIRPGWGERASAAPLLKNSGYYIIAHLRGGEVTS